MDPDVPEDVTVRLRSRLMAARRAVAMARRAQDTAAERATRDHVHTAKVALGERGMPWWDQQEPERRARWSDGLAALDEQGDQEGRRRNVSGPRFPVPGAPERPYSRHPRTGRVRLNSPQRRTLSCPQRPLSRNPRRR
ncbi:hypothetical protein ACIGW0_23845 [Streptomyces bikiniensis]|uniref:Uncharacterized protein n=1 Tax=Streptomyces bikiniensis TaxID=1896 RepID=A0ABW8D059_STRBI